MKKILTYVLCMCLLLCTAVCSVSAANATEIKDDAVLEFEQFAGEENQDLYSMVGSLRQGTPYGTYVAYDDASGGAFLALAERIGLSELNMTIPVNVTESGYYKVTLMSTISTQNGGSMGPIRVTMNDCVVTNKISDGTLFRTTQGAAMDTAVDADCFYYSSFHQFVSSAYLTAGEQNFNVNILANTSGAIGIKVLMDCLKFEKITPHTLSAEAETVVEAEDYLNAVAYTHPAGTVNTALRLDEAKASGGFVMDMNEKMNITGFRFSVPVKVAQSGHYEMNLLASNGNGGSTSILTVYDGAVKLVDSTSAYTVGDSLYWGQSDPHSDWRDYYGVYNHVSTRYLEAGDHVLTFVAEPISNSPTYTKFVADCLKFKLVAKDFSETGLKLELEDCTSFMDRSLTQETNDDGCTYVNTYGGDTLNMELTLNVVQGGCYNIIYHGSPYLGGGRSKTNIYLDDALVLDNDESKNGAPIKADGAKDYFGLYLDGYEFRLDNVYIASGVHVLRMEALTRPESTVAFGADYIEFVRLEDEAILGEQSVAVKAYFDEEISGTVVLAAYCGKQMVGVHFYEDMDCTYVNATIPYTGEEVPDNVKVMVWWDLYGLAPVTSAKTISVN